MKHTTERLAVWWDDGAGSASWTTLRDDETVETAQRRAIDSGDVDGPEDRGDETEDDRAESALSELVAGGWRLRALGGPQGRETFPSWAPPSEWTREILRTRAEEAEEEVQP